MFFCEAAIVTHSYCISDSMDLIHDFSQSSRKISLSLVYWLSKFVICLIG